MHAGVRQFPERDPLLDALAPPRLLAPASGALTLALAPLLALALTGIVDKYLERS